MGLGDFFFGSDGYRPDEQGVRQSYTDINKTIQANMPGSYTRKKKEGTGQYVSVGKGRRAWIPEEYEDEQTYTPEKLQLDYTPGSSGYKITGQNSMLPQYSELPQLKQYSPTEYNAPTLMNEAEKYYGQLENQSTNQLLASGQAGLDMMQSTMGRRGLANSGVNRQAQGGLMDTMARQINEAKTNIGFQRARDYNDIAQKQAELDYRAATFKEDANRFGTSLSDQRRQQALQEMLSKRQQSLQEISTEAELDRALRGEKINQYYLPLNLMMQQYATDAGIAAKGESGVLNKVGSFASGMGNFMSGGADLYSAYKGK